MAYGQAPQYSHHRGPLRSFALALSPPCIPQRPSGGDLEEPGALERPLRERSVRGGPGRPGCKGVDSTRIPARHPHLCFMAVSRGVEGASRGQGPADAAGTSGCRRPVLRSLLIPKKAPQRGSISASVSSRTSAAVQRAAGPWRAVWFCLLGSALGQPGCPALCDQPESQLMHETRADNWSDAAHPPCPLWLTGTVKCTASSLSCLGLG